MTAAPSSTDVVDIAVKALADIDVLANTHPHELATRQKQAEYLIACLAGITIHDGRLTKVEYCLTCMQLARLCETPGRCA